MMPRKQSRTTAVLVSFSGMDGAGKSTQIENLQRSIAAAGYTERTIAFWDDVVVGCGWREGFVHKAYGSERGVGAPGKPVARRDKNIRRWYLTLARHALYFADAVHLRWVIARERRSADVLICDRYIYDELANLPLGNRTLGNRMTRAYVALVARLAPQPDIAFVLDAEPEAARERKPEYPVEFMRECRAAYKALVLMLRNIVLIPPLPLPQALASVETGFWIGSGLPRKAANAITEVHGLDAVPAA